MDSPLVSCLCVTDTDTHSLVEGLIEDFQSQDYPNKELIIINNCSSQAKNADLLIDSTPNVFIYDTPQRLSQGVAKNYAIRQSNGLILANFYINYRHSAYRISHQMLALAESGCHACIIDKFYISSSKGSYLANNACLDSVLCIRPKDVDFIDSDYGYNKEFLVNLVKNNYLICSIDGKDLLTRISKIN